MITLLRVGISTIRTSAMEATRRKIQLKPDRVSPQRQTQASTAQANLVTAQPAGVNQPTKGLASAIPIEENDMKHNVSTISAIVNKRTNAINHLTCFSIP